MANITLTLDTVNPVLDAILAEYGEDHVYAWPQSEPEDEGGGCVYAYDGEPSCIVGQVLSRLGVSVPDLEALDSHIDSRFGVLAKRANNAPGVLSPLEKIGLAWEDDAIALLSTIQVAQDTGDPWGEAVQAGRWRVPS